MRHSTAAALALLLCTAAVETRQGPPGRGSGPVTLVLSNPVVGRVVDTAGKGVYGAIVTALRPTQGVRPFEAVSPSLTAMSGPDGAFRLEGAPLGEFYFVAIPQNIERDNSGLSNRSGYSTTYFPSAVDIKTAKLVKLLPGPRPEIVIVLRPVPLVYLSGHVIGRGGPPGQGSVLLSHGDGLSAFNRRTVPLMRDGSFEVGALQPGPYVLTYSAGTVSQANVVIGKSGTDVSGVRVTPLGLVSGSGRLVVAPGDLAALRASGLLGHSPAPGQLTRSMIYAIVMLTQGDIPGRVAQPAGIREDLSFDFTTWPGTGHIRLNLPTLQWTLKGIRVNGADVTNQVLTFTADKPLTGIEIEIARVR